MTSSATLLTTKECICYVQEQLMIKKVKTKLNADPKSLLDSIVCSFQERVPIQTITLHLVPPEERRRPSWMTVKNNIFSGIGGMCYEMNVFMFALLKGLRYDVQLILANASSRLNHVIIIVQNVSISGDLYFVDVGNGFPTFQAVDLTFHGESPVYQQSFLDYKFVKKEGRIFRMHMPHREVLTNSQLVNNNSQWKRYCDFKLNPLPLEQINQRLDKVYKDVTSTTSHRVLRCIFFPGQRACAFRNNVILRENDCRLLEETGYGCDYDLKTAVCETFAMFSDMPELVGKAINRWRLNHFKE